MPRAAGAAWAPRAPSPKLVAPQTPIRASCVLCIVVSRIPVAPRSQRRRRMIQQMIVLVVISLTVDRRGRTVAPVQSQISTRYARSEQLAAKLVVCERDQKNERRCGLPIRDFTACESGKILSWHLCTLDAQCVVGHFDSGPLPCHCREWPHCTLSCQDPVHTCTAYPELLRNSRGAETHLVQTPDLVGFDTGLATLVDAPSLGSVNALHLPFPPQVVLELAENAQHRQECLPCRTAGVDGLLRGFQVDALLPQFMYDVLEVTQASRQPVDAGDNQRVAGPQELQQGLEGIVSKRRTSGYVSGPWRHWVKTKCPNWKRENAERHRLFEQPSGPTISEHERAFGEKARRSSPRT